MTKSKQPAMMSTSPQVARSHTINGVEYKSFYQSLPYQTKFGSILWNVTNLTTGTGYGGIVKTPEAAIAAITAALADEEAGTSGSDYAEIPF